MESHNIDLSKNLFEISLNPEKYGYKQCPHCNGYGSSLKDPEGVDICTRCHGSGLIKELQVNE